MNCSSTRFLCPWDFPGKNTGEGCHFLLQGIFPTQGSNLCLLHWQEDSLPLSYLEISSVVGRIWAMTFVPNVMTINNFCAQLYLTLRPHGLYSPPGSSVLGDSIYITQQMASANVMKVINELGFKIERVSWIIQVNSTSSHAPFQVALPISPRQRRK